MQLDVIPKAYRLDVARTPRNERKRGSTTDFHPELVSELAALSMAGWNDAEIAAEIGVSVRTLYRWKQAHADFAAALRFNNEEGVARVKGAFFAKATGFHYVEQQAIKVKTGEHTEEVQVVDVTKYVPPSDTAGIFFLKNRDPANWREQHDVNVTGALDVKNADVRSLALALLATIQAGLQAPVIEHKEDEA